MQYQLAEACQNSFILFDLLNDQSLTDTFLKYAQICLLHEKRDDALIIHQGTFEKKSLFAKMTVLGADGALGEFCGNGSRAVAAYLFEKHPFLEQIFLTTPEGNHRLLATGMNEYSISLPKAKFELNRKFIANEKKFRTLKLELQYAETLEPHLGICAEMSDEALFKLGRMLNAEKEIFPLGINVNAWHPLKENSIFVKTYERGVQRLTKSCGTGSVACASIYRSSGDITVHTPGGTLKISHHEHGVELKGPAVVTHFCI